MEEKISSLFELTSYILCSIIGFSIFYTPMLVYAKLENLFFTILALLLAGLISLINGFNYGELARKYPNSNGDPSYYEYFYGRKASLFYSVISAAIICPLAIASASTYICSAVNMHGNIYLSIFILTALTILNLSAFNFSIRIQSFFTGIKVALSIILFFISIYFIFQSNKNEKINFSTNNFSISTFLYCVTISLNMYDGFNSANYISFNVRKGLISRGITIALIFTIIYYGVFATALFKTCNLNEIFNSGETLLSKASIQLNTGRVLPALIEFFASLSSMNGTYITMKSIIRAICDKQYFNHTLMIALVIFSFILQQFNRLEGLLSMTTSLIYIFYFFSIFTLIIDKNGKKFIILPILSCLICFVVFVVLTYEIIKKF